MTTGSLLDELINIADISKTDFALSTYMSPSALSLILSGKRLPGNKSKKRFTQDAAVALARAIYGYQCCYKLKAVFPIIYDFASRHELESFLQFALEYTLDRDQAVENELNLDYPSHAVTYLRDRQILNMICIILSDYLQSADGGSLSFFSYLPLQPGPFDPVFRRILVTGRGQAGRMTYNQTVDTGGTRTDFAINLDTLQYMKRIEEHSDLVFWEVPELVGEPFLMLKGHFILLLKEQADHNLTMTIITHKGFVQNFYAGLYQSAVKISYNRDELLEALADEPQWPGRLEGKITSVFNFSPIGYFLTEDEISETGAPDLLAGGVHELFQLILNADIRFYSSDAAVNDVLNEGEIMVPMCGTIKLPAEERIAFLGRLLEYAQDGDRPKFKLLSTRLTDAAIICAEGLTLIYSVDHSREKERIHVFHTDRFEAAILQRIRASGVKPLSYSEEQWADYLLEKEQLPVRSGPLIEALIDLAGLSKVAFASAVDLSPSALSRLLSGERQPGLSDKRPLSIAASTVLARHIYRPGCWLSLRGLYPVLYDFGSQHELRLFLQSAIEYAIDMDLLASLETASDYPESEHAWFGPRRVLNMLCVIMSDAIRTDAGEELVFYSSLPILFKHLPQTVSRMRFMFGENEYPLTWNQTLNPGDFPADFGEDNPLDVIRQMEAQCSLRLWETRTEKPYYLLLKDRFLIMLGTMPDTTPSLTLIRNRNYLIRFYRYIVGQQSRKLTYDREEIRERLNADPDLPGRLLAHRLVASYNFVNFGYFLTDEEMTEVEPSPARRRQLMTFFHDLLNADAKFYPSAPSLGEFVRTGRTVVPFSGTLQISAEKRVEYLQRFEGYASQGTLDRTQTLYGSVFNAAILCTQNLTFVYFISPDGAREKVHLLYASGIDRLLESAISKMHVKRLPYSEQTWSTYLDEVKTRLT